MDSLKGLIVVIALATAVFAFAGQTVNALSLRADFTRRRNLWFAITLAAFLSPNFWVYTFIAIPLLIYANRRETNPPALFFILLFALPSNATQIPGIGSLNLFELSHPRLLELFILLPAFISRPKQNNTLSFGRLVPDKFIATYLLLTCGLFARDGTLTDTLRLAFYLFLDIFLPYVVVSRYLKDMQTFRNALFSFSLALMLLALVGVFEFLKNWLLYEPLVASLQMGSGMTGYIMRDGMLRVVASAGQPIVLGYLMVVGIGVFLFLRRSMQNNFVRRAGILLLLGGLIVPLSRGPWIGAVFLLLVFIVSGRNPVRPLMKLAMAGMLAISLLAVLPGTERIINLLPFVGTTEKENVDFRENLITNSLIVIERNPWFGSNKFLEAPEIEALRVAQNQIDIVNSYLRVALEKGIVGLGLFVGFFALTLFGIRRAMRSISDRESEEYLLGRVLLSTLLTIMMMIFTVSGISFIPIVYWSVAGMGVAYTQMIRREAAARSTNAPIP